MKHTIGNLSEAPASADFDKAAIETLLAQRQALQSARDIVADAKKRSTRRRCRRLFDALLAEADTKLAVIDRAVDQVRT